MADAAVRLTHDGFWPEEGKTTPLLLSAAPSMDETENDIAGNDLSEVVFIGAGTAI